MINQPVVTPTLNRSTLGRGLPISHMGGPMNTDKGFTRPTCHMPGCSIEIQPSQKYCDACLWAKKLDLVQAEII